MAFDMPKILEMIDGKGVEKRKEKMISEIKEFSEKMDAEKKEKVKKWIETNPNLNNLSAFLNKLKVEGI